MRKTAVFILTIFTVFSGFAEDLSDNIFSADIPIIYGEEDFLRRIEERTGGEREPTGLVLSGGSARAFAHIGVLKYLEEKGIAVDFIVTNSMGSIVGMLYAAGMSPEQIERSIGEIDMGELFLFSYPLNGGIIEPVHLTSFVHSILGDLDLKETGIPLMLLCEDLKTKRQIRICEGDFYTLLEAAYALPFYFPPVEFRGHLLIDGGVTNILPLKPAYDYTDTVIVSTTFYNNPFMNYGNPITILNIAIDVGKSRSGIEDIKNYNPITIRCDVEEFSFMSFDAIDVLSERGYISAEKAGAELSDLPAGTVFNDFTYKRESIEESLEKVFADYRYQNCIPLKDPFFRAGIGLFMNDYPLDPFYLVDDLFLFGFGSFKTGGLTGSLRTGGIWDLYDTGNWVLGTEIDINQRILPWLSAGAGTRLSYDTDLRGFDITGLYSRGNILLTPVSSRVFKLNISWVLESMADDFDFPDNTLLTGLFDLGFDGRADIDLASGVQLEDLSESSFFSDIEAFLPLSRSWGLKERIFTRIPFGETSEVKSFRRDYFRGKTWTETYENLAFNSFELTFSPADWNPTFAEVLILKNTSVSAYTDTGWFDEWKWTAGIEIEATGSLIGLTPFQLSGYLGWDGSGETGSDGRISGGLFIMMNG